MDNFRFEKSVPAVETDGLTSGMDEEIRYLDRIESKDPRTAQSELVCDLLFLDGKVGPVDCGA